MKIKQKMPKQPLTMVCRSLSLNMDQQMMTQTVASIQTKPSFGSKKFFVSRAKRIEISIAQVGI